MKKYYLKKSYIKNELIVTVTNLVLSLFSWKFKKREKTIIKITDGLGDIVIRSQLLLKIQEHYRGKDISFIIKEEYVFLGEVLGLPVITLSQKEKNTLLGRIKKMYEINTMGIKKFVNIEWSNDSVIRNVRADEIAAVPALEEQDMKNNRVCDTLIEVRKEPVFNDEKRNILEILQDVGEALLNKKIETEELKPDLRRYFSDARKNRGIVIGVGTTGRDRVCSPYRMIEYIEVLFRYYPDEMIYLVGNGRRQKEYAQLLVKHFSDSRIADLTDETKLKEVLNLTAQAELFIGFDSGLYNFRYTLHKKQIALFKSRAVPYAHCEENLILLEGKPETDAAFFDENYPDKLINSITPKAFEEAVIKLKNYK